MKGQVTARLTIGIVSIINTEVFNKKIDKESGNYRGLPDGEQGSF